jgi:hypothetical protein
LRSLNREEHPDVDEIVRRYLADQKDFEHFYGADINIWNENIENMSETARAILAFATHP